MAEILPLQVSTNIVPEQPEIKKELEEVSLLKSLEPTETKDEKGIKDEEEKSNNIHFDSYCLVDLKAIHLLPKRIQEYSSNHHVKWLLKGKALELQAASCMNLVESEYTTVKNCIRFLRILRNNDWSYQAPFLPPCIPDVPFYKLFSQTENATKSKDKRIIATKPTSFTEGEMSSLSRHTRPLQDSHTVEHSAPEGSNAELASEGHKVTHPTTGVSPTKSNTEVIAPEVPNSTTDNSLHPPFILLAEELTNKVQKALDHSRHTIMLLQKIRQLLIRQTCQSLRLYSDLKRIRKASNSIINEPSTKKSKKSP